MLCLDVAVVATAHAAGIKKDEVWELPLRANGIKSVVGELEVEPEIDILSILMLEGVIPDRDMQSLLVSDDANSISGNSKEEVICNPTEGGGKDSRGLSRLKEGGIHSSSSSAIGGSICGCLSHFASVSTSALASASSFSSQPYLFFFLTPLPSVMLSVMMSKKIEMGQIFFLN